MKKIKILFFSGNRAEFGYLLPFMIELNNIVDIDFIVTGTHLLPPWNSIKEIEQSFKKYNLNANILKIQVPNVANAQINSFALIHQESANILKQTVYSYAFVLGDRPESFAFSTAVAFCDTPLIHYAGGDVTDGYYLDSTLRHAITKLAHLHLTLSNDSFEVVHQLGEELWRIKNVGISTYDYDRLGLLPSIENIKDKFSSFDFSKKIMVVTYHSTQYKNAHDNYLDFMILLKVINKFDLNIILTYPNNDSGSKEMLDFLVHHKFKENLFLVKTLGTLNLLSLYKNFKTIVVGNSSGGLLETTLYKTPTINIGDRQGNRKRTKNVFDVDLDEEKLEEKISYILNNYEKIKIDADESKGAFGFGDTTRYLRDIVQDKSLDKEKLMFKRFIFSN